MKRILLIVLTALTLGGAFAVALPAGPAQAALPGFLGSSP